MKIKLVRTEEDAANVRRLARGFVDWLGERYPEYQDRIDAYLEAQNFETELERLLDIFGPPDGECVLAILEGTPAGTVMLRRRNQADCEMNRMFVAPEARGHGIGRALCRELIDRAKALGYRNMLLDAGMRHHEAVALYRSLGFVDDDREDGFSGEGMVQMKLVLDRNEGSG